MADNSAIPPETIALLKKEASEKGLNFSMISEDLRVKADPPKPKYIWSQAWTSGGHPGHTLRHIIYIQNPSPKWEHSLHVTYFIGFPNFNDIFQSWVHRDTRWQDWTSAPFTLEGNAKKMEILHDHLIPNVPPSNYTSIAVLWRSELGMESYLDFSMVSLGVVPK
jgi:hypothetical protein